MATFRTTLWASGGNNVAIVVPEDVVLSFGRGKRVPVTVTVDDDYTYRTTIASMGGQYLITFNAQTRAVTGRGAGDEVDVTLELDDAPRTVEVPAVLAQAFETDPDAAAAWSGLSYSKQKAHAQAIEGAKTDETRQRRLDKILTELRAAH
ncbi:YdeI/OmpD-associated family protein [Haloactinopolyspora sp.]|uniref:YdeI/OmpD-associated family protein n=1 Tax=Haloactinopolyspora sp. TaxID=1966353 RepID=UPI002631EACB|nr:YdeI/OmpD-associated family protein [Haloactinopolyspora sp.]